MKLTVLGGSAAGANTGAGCSGLLVQSTTTSVVLDFGPGTLVELRSHADFRTLDGVVISHLHVDHILDLAALRFALAYNPIRPPAPVRLLMPPGGRSHLDHLADALAVPDGDPEFFSAVFAIEEYDPDQVAVIGDIALRFAPTVHYVPCWAMRLSSPSASGDLVYTADTGPAADLSGFAAGASVVAAEATLFEPGTEPFASRGHLTAREAGALAQRAGAQTLLLVHLWEEVGFDAYRTGAAAVFPGTIEIGRPGLSLEW